MRAPHRGHVVDKKRKDLSNKSSAGTRHPVLSAGRRAALERGCRGELKEHLSLGARAAWLGGPGEQGERARSHLLFSRTGQSSRLWEDQSDSSCPEGTAEWQWGPFTRPVIAATARNLLRGARHPRGILEPSGEKRTSSRWSRRRFGHRDADLHAR